MSERRLIAMCGGGLFLLVLVAYIETMAGSTSFWDCGEFIATAYSLGIPHPPATPLYVVLGRVFTLLPLPLSVAQKVNFMSALFGALGIIVLFFLIVDIVPERRGPAKTLVDRIVIYPAATHNCPASVVISIEFCPTCDRLPCLLFERGFEE